MIDKVIREQNMSIVFFCISLYICGSTNGSSRSAVNTGEGCETRLKGAVLVLLGIWNQISHTVIHEKCCSYLSFSISSKRAKDYIL